MTSERKSAMMRDALENIATPDEDVGSFYVIRDGERVLVCDWSCVQWRMDRAKRAIDSAPVAAEQPARESAEALADRICAVERSTPLGEDNIKIAAIITADRAASDARIAELEEKLRVMGQWGVPALMQAKLAAQAAEIELWKENMADELEQTKRLIDALGVHDVIADGKSSMDAMLEKIAALKLAAAGKGDIESLKCVRDNTATALRQAEAAAAMCNGHVAYLRQLDILATHAVQTAALRDGAGREGA